MTFSDTDVKQLYFDETNRFNRPDGKNHRDSLDDYDGDFHFSPEDDLINDLRDAGFQIRNIHDPVILTES